MGSILSELDSWNLCRNYLEGFYENTFPIEYFGCCFELPGFMRNPCIRACFNIGQSTDHCSDIGADQHESGVSHDASITDQCARLHSLQHRHTCEGQDQAHRDHHAGESLIR